MSNCVNCDKEIAGHELIVASEKRFHKDCFKCNGCENALGGKVLKNN